MPSYAGRGIYFVAKHPAAQVMLCYMQDHDNTVSKDLWSCISQSAHIRSQTNARQKMSGKLNILRQNGFFVPHRWTTVGTATNRVYRLSQNALESINHHPEWREYYNLFIADPDILTDI